MEVANVPGVFLKPNPAQTAVKGTKFRTCKLTLDIATLLLSQDEAEFSLYPVKILNLIVFYRVYKKIGSGTDKKEVFIGVFVPRTSLNDNLVAYLRLEFGDKTNIED